MIESAAWFLAKPCVSALMLGATKPSHVHDVIDVVLSEEDPLDRVRLTEGLA